MAKKQTKIVYHYTNDKGKEAIENSGVIQPSENGAYGKAAYFTSMSPDKGKKAVSMNNWDNYKTNYWLDKETQGYANHAVKMEMPEDKMSCPDARRDIYTHEGPVKLQNHKWIKVTKK